MDIAAAELACSPAALELLGTLPPYDHAAALTVADRLRKPGIDAELISVVLTQSRLRAAAKAKLGDFAQGMLFTQAGLEQATRLVVAAHHAQRFRKAGIGAVADLTCGLGVDAMAMAALGIDVTAFEVDRATALLADYNLRHWQHARVVNADAIATMARGPLDVQGVFADPARRDGSGRKHQPSDYSPPLDQIIALEQNYRHVGIKVGPALPHDAVPPGAQAEWVSVDGDVVEAGLWMGDLCSAPGHSAMIIAGGTAHYFAGEPVPGDVAELSDYLYEPDGAIIRAGLVGPLAASIGATLIDPHIAYLTAGSAIHSPFAQGFKVREVLPYSDKGLASALASRGIGTAEIKKRGVDVDPDALRKRLKLKGGNRITVVITRLGTKRLAILCDRLPAQV